MSTRFDLIRDLIRTRNLVAASALAGLLIAARALAGRRRSTWLVFLFGVLAVALGYALRRFAG